MLRPFKRTKSWLSRTPLLGGGAWLLVMGGLAASLHAQEEDELASPPKIDAAFVVPADLRGFTLDVQAMEPRWLYEKQIDKWFPIQSFASEIAHVSAEPLPVPATMKKTLEEVLVVGTSGAKKIIENGPMMGPDRAYVVFDSERKPVVVIYLYRIPGILRTHRVRNVSEEDMFQLVGSWTSFADSKQIVDFLGTIEAEAKRPKTLFQKWRPPSDWDRLKEEMEKNNEERKIEFEKRKAELAKPKAQSK